MTYIDKLDREISIAEKQADKMIASITEVLRLNPLADVTRRKRDFGALCGRIGALKDAREWYLAGSG